MKRERQTNGRHVDGAIGILDGEAAGIASAQPERAATLGAATLAKVERASVPRGEPTTTYHEQPLLKAPVWKAFIPTYFFVGGAAGASAALGAAAQLAGGPRMAPLVAPARWIAAGGAVISAGLLVADLGRPARFLNMLRVFRPTSPMNMGTWILTGFGAASGAAAALPLVGARGAGDVAGAIAGPFGVGLASYTAVLLASTAVPVWQDGRRALPPLFVASAAASASSALELAPGVERARRSVRAFGGVARVAELAAGRLYERELERRGDAVARTLREGRAGKLWRASKVLSVASLGLSALASMRGRAARASSIASGVIGLAGALALRFAVVEAGRASTRDPRATLEPQRRDRDARRARAGIPISV